MSKKIFINLPVQDLETSISFYESLGFNINPQFTDETAACVVISDEIYAMILTHEKFQTFTSKTIANSKQTAEVLVALSADSREEVDEYARKAEQAGGKSHRHPSDHGWMYERAIEDLDGHIWEFIWMDPTVAEQ